MAKLSEPEIETRLSGVKDWDRLGDMLVRSWLFPSFRRAMEFVNSVAALAESQGYHPDIVISFRTVRLELSTHAEGGLTEADFGFAAAVNQLPTDR